MAQQRKHTIKLENRLALLVNKSKVLRQSPEEDFGHSALGARLDRSSFEGPASFACMFSIQLGLKTNYTKLRE